MLEAIILFLVPTLVTACFFSQTSVVGLVPIKFKFVEKSVKPAAELSTIAEKNVQSSISSTNDFLAELRTEIERELPPRPTDSTLRRHHEALITAELQSRLAKMPRY